MKSRVYLIEISRNSPMILGVMIDLTPPSAWLPCCHQSNDCGADRDVFHGLCQHSTSDCDSAHGGRCNEPPPPSKAKPRDMLQSDYTADE
eukprot:CAMPEP_0171983436 /NCGR_PEP_ID=MMETSP0993-20121228/273302_1 /TAXON_ID=483369 /ORGANISM="non described non described, Strain CCMP2098" /LENGTH=89 /DNA_ID=CAMNT_0012636205 /DNA_START=469 /DNA_END=738 /DNA_ORIENTATION=-